MLRKDPMAYPSKVNPITSAEQYGLMQAIAHGGVLRQDFDISPEVAREMIEKTPRRLRSKFAMELMRQRHGKNPVKRTTKRGFWEQGLSKSNNPDEVYRVEWREAKPILSGDISTGMAYFHRLQDAQKYVEDINRDVGKIYYVILHEHRVIETTYPKGTKYYFANPSDRTAESLTEEWHGREPKEVLDYEETEHYEADGAILAELEEFGVILEGLEETITIEFSDDPPMLVANVATETLELVGGDQRLEYDGEWETKSEIPVGYVYLIAYNTDKHHLEGSTGKPESYEHFFGEEYYKSRGYKVSSYDDSDEFFQDLLEDGIVEDAIQEGYLPTMVYDTVNSKIRLVGGRYTIEDVGLRD